MVLEYCCTYFHILNMENKGQGQGFQNKAAPGAQHRLLPPPTFSPLVLSPYWLPKVRANGTNITVPPISGLEPSTSYHNGNPAWCRLILAKIPQINEISNSSYDSIIFSANFTILHKFCKKNVTTLQGYLYCKKFHTF